MKEIHTMLRTEFLPLRMRLKTPLLALVLALVGPEVLAQGEDGSNGDLATFVDPSAAGAKVDKVTGAFSFSLPLLTLPGAAGEGYPITLGYAPPSPNQPASWVGYGWSLGPGSIQRNANGIPDDFNGVEIININKAPVHHKITISGTAGFEVFSNSALGLSKGIAWDSERGILPSFSLSLSGFGAGISYMQEGGDGQFSANFSPVQAAISIAGAAKNSTSDADDDPIARLNYSNYRHNEKLNKAVKKRALTNLATRQGFSWTPSLHGLPNHQNGIKEFRLSGELSGQYAGIPDGGPELGIRVSYDQTSQEVTDNIESFGYLHSGRVSLSNESTMSAMDFFEERPHSLDEYDKFIPLPIQTPDQFSVSAGNLGGSFRSYYTVPGAYYPRGIDHSSNAGAEIGVELGAGFGPASGNVVVGGSAALDLTSEIDIRTWTAEYQSGKEFEFPTGKNATYFAFKGDIGLQRTLAAEGATPRAKAKNNFKKYRAASYFGKDATRHHELEYNGFNSSMIESGAWRPELNKTIRWNTAEEMEKTANSIHYYQFDKRDYSSFVNYGSLPADALAEFEILDESGMRYTFGIPVYERNNLELSFSTDPVSSGATVGEEVVFVDGPNVANIFDGSINWESELDDWDRVNGKFVKQAMANSWLLTSITSSDYVDITGNGCTDDDLGSWVKFHYQQLFGNADKQDAASWFKFRDPVSGCRYSEGTEGDNRDNMASFSCGEKEVYVLTEIETRTHKAVFTSTPRNDGASINNFNAAYLADSWSSGKLKKLDQIDLYAKNQGGAGTNKLLQTVKFQYDFSSWPAAAANQGGPSGSAGKMTLKNVLVYSFGVAEDVHKTTFEYEYPEYDSSHPSDPLPWMDDENLEAKYADLFAEFDGLNEAPNYIHNLVDPWGLPKDYGTDYWSRQHRWRRVNAAAPPSNADPAAYCLKQITMSSGAVIMPQYERSDYRWVQDQLAEVMVPLTGPTSDHDRFFIDTEYLRDGLGWDTTDAAIHVELTERLEGKRTYLKPLYYMPAYSSVPAAGGEGWNYFSGFVKIQNVGSNSSGIFLRVEDTGNYGLPRKTCQDFCDKYPRVGLAGYPPEALTVEFDFNGNTPVVSTVQDLVDAGKASLDQRTQIGGFNCPDFHAPESYVRIPLLNGESKQGGGLRVKRLLVYDPGIEDGGTKEGELLTGTEYRYEKWNANLDKWVSSGVASNEPKSMYEECTLFDPLPKASQGRVERFLGGKDTETQAGPIGEHFLPSPSVTYEEVTERSIHDDLSGEGEVITRYFSHRSHPVQITWTDPSKSQLDKVEPNPISSLVNPLTLKALWYSQGVRIETNDMAGKMQETISYAAQRDQDGVRVPVAKTIYDYREPGEAVTILDGIGTEAEQVSFGTFDEAYVMGKFVRNHKVNARVEADFNASITVAGLPFAFPSVWPSGAVMTELQGSHATVLQSHRPAMIQSITTEKTGMETVVENIAYDKATGQALLTSTTDGFTGMQFSADGTSSGVSTFDQKRLDLTISSLPWYDELGKVSKNDRLILTTGVGILEHVDEVNCRVERFISGTTYEFLAFLEFCIEPPHDLCGILGEDGLFYPGDVLKVYGKDPSAGASRTGFWHVESVDGNRVYLQGSQKMSSWAPVNVEEIDIITSGRANRLGASYAEAAIYDDELSVSTTQNPAAEPFLELVDFLNANVIPEPGAGPTNTQTSILGGTWDPVEIEEANCTAMNGGIGLDRFYMQFDGNNSCGSGYIAFPDPPNITTVTVIPNNGGGGSTTNGGNGGNNGDPIGPARVVNLGSQIVIPIHYSSGSEGPGEFSFDGELGAIVWTSPATECSPTVVFTACEDYSDIQAVANVMAVSATSLSDAIEQPAVNYPSGSTRFYNDLYEFGGRGRWVDEKSFVFDGTTRSLLDEDGETTHSTQVGLMDDFTLLSPYHTDYAGDQWINTVVNEKLDERGRVIQSSDAYGYEHAVGFSTAENRPIWSADAATENSCSFESFENFDSSSGTLTDSNTSTTRIKGDRSAKVAHSGSYSWKFGTLFNCGRAILPEITLDPKTWNQGIRIRFWAHEPRRNSDDNKIYTLDEVFKVGLHGSTLSNTDCASSLDFIMPADSVVQTGRWVLIDGFIPPEELAASFSEGDVVTPVIECDRSAESQINKVYIDDLRIQPAQASMTCSVFDPNDFRILTDFDGNHFGTYYQYNQKGQLTRTLVETESGLKTVSELHQHVPEEN